MTHWWGAIVTVLVIGSGALAGGPAAAHDGGSDPDGSSAQTAEQHAKEDLVGVPISTIEARTAAHARALDLDPPSSAQRAAIDPAALGAWSEVVKTPVVPVMTAVLPNGKVLMWDSIGDSGSTPDGSVHTFTRAAVWDPVANTSKDVGLQGYNIFCAGYVQLPDGDVLIVGGNRNNAQDGIVQTHLFHWRTETWSRGPDMAAERWYPSVAALADGSALIVAGGTKRAEIFTPDLSSDAGTGAIRPVIGFDSFASREYPFLFPRTDGDVELLGPDFAMFRYDLDGAKSYYTGDLQNEKIYRNAGSFAAYLPDRALVTGGGFSTSPPGVQSSASAVVAELGSSARPTPTHLTSPMSQGRRQHNLTVLADGTVLATGGMDSTTEPLVDLDSAVKLAEVWNPSTEKWTQLSSAARVREYHSSATLLPDGRVMTGGGGVCGDCVQAGYLEKNVEYFSPPYLFAPDGRPAVRPALTGVPAHVDNATTFTFSSSSAASIAKVSLVRLGANTHSVDQGQRYVPLTFRRSGTVITATGPANDNVAPPGYYMMFAVSAAGVPSMGAVMHVGSVGGPPTPAPTPDPTPDPTPTVAPTTAAPNPTPTVTPTTTAPNPTPTVTPTTTAPTTSPPTGGVVDAGPRPVVIGPVVVTPDSPRCLEAATSPRGVRVVRWTCTNDANQTWRRGAGGSMRALGRCLTFGDGRSAEVGDRVALARCNRGTGQRVIRRGTSIRPAVAQDLCVGTGGRALTPGQRPRLQRCDGSPSQRWTL